MSQSPRDLLVSLVVERGPFALLTLALVVVLPAALLLLARPRGLGHLPLLGRELGGADKRRRAYLTDMGALYKRGYDLFKDRPFRVTTQLGERVIVPVSALDELRNLPTDVLNVNKELDKMMETPYTKVPGGHDFMAHLVKSDLNKRLNGLVADLAVEVETTVGQIFPACEDWTPMVLYEKLLTMAAIISGSVFIGKEHCRDPLYINQSIMYTVIVHTAKEKLQKWSPALRWLAARFFVPELSQAHDYREATKRFLIPIIQERRRLIASGGPAPQDMVTWMLAKADEWRLDDDELALTEIQLSIAAIHTSSMTLSTILYELAVRPEEQRALRAEARAVLAAHGAGAGAGAGGDGRDLHHPTPRALYDLRLLDSFMKETMRTNPPTTVRFPRYVERSITLRDGTVLPRGASLDALLSPPLSDPRLYPDPGVFDARRFLRLRSGEAADPLGYKNKEQYQFIGANKEDIFWGYGPHACPGRFFANAQMKLIIVQLLARFEMRRPGGSREKIPQIPIAGGWAPDHAAVIEFRDLAKEES